MKKFFATICVVLCFMVFTPFTAMADTTGQWVNNYDGDPNRWWYLRSDGTNPTYQWEYINGYWYFFNGDGYMLYGWQYIDGRWYYLDLGSSNMADLGKWREDAYDANAEIPGIDVSSWQGEIDWDAVKGDGIQFTMIRLGYEDRNLDPYFVRNITQANAVGIKTGVYYYSTATNVVQAIIDAQYVIDNLQGYTVSYPVAIDIEDHCQAGLSKQEITDICKAFCNEIEKAGYTPMVYSSESWFRNKIDVSQLQGVERWVAGWMANPSSDIERGIWQTGSSLRLYGIGGRVDSDLAIKDYSTIVTARESASPYYNRTKGFWHQDSNGWWFQYLYGDYPKSMWEAIDGSWYYFDANGYIIYGWFAEGGNWYYLDSEGKLYSGWLDLNGSRYYLGDKGVMATGWTGVGGTWYFFNTNGAMYKGWLPIGDTWYYLKDDGAMATGWQFINGVWYYLNSNGSMSTGWAADGSSWYYLNSNGAMYTGWLPIGSSWYYMCNNGNMLTGWQFIDGYWYYLDANGSMSRGWQGVGNDWYYLYDNGIMATGWIVYGNSWYYLNESGSMLTGWQFIDGYWYYFNQYGTMLSNTYVDGYYLSESGAWA